MPVIPNPTNEIQVRFNELCEQGGGRKGGPVKREVQLLLRDGGRRLNVNGYRDAQQNLHEYSGYNPWHVCFALGLCWGHLARTDVHFVGAAVRLLQAWNSDDLKLARSFHMERGPKPIEDLLMGARSLFDRVTLPPQLPGTLKALSDLQNRWLSPILSANRPRYIGSWNATAMFTMALFAQPRLAATMTDPGPMLPPGGPVVFGLTLLHRSHLLSRKPEGNALDEADAWPSSLYLNNTLFTEIRSGLDDWSLIDVHSGIYMLGTRSPESNSWI